MTPLTPTGSPSVFGGIGRLEFSQGAPDDPFPAWTDITPYVRTEEWPVTITRGRQTELDPIEAGQLTAMLDNTDNRFTFGYTGGPYGANWTPAKQVRYTETIGGRTFQEFKGYVEAPDLDNWQPIGYQQVRLNCTDRQTRLSRGRTFVSTLAEHIIFNGGSRLIYYAPCNDASFPLIDIKARRAARVVGSSSNFATPANVAGPPGDDISFVRAYPVSLPFATYFQVDNLPVSVASGQTLALSAWFRSEAAPSADTLTGRFLATLASTTGSDILTIQEDISGVLAIGGTTAPYGAPSTGRRLERDAWRLVTARLSLPSGLVEIWIGADMAASATMGVIPSSMSMDQFSFAGSTYWGAVGHVQVYVGPTGTFPYAQHVAQHRMGFAGLEYQTTGQRINTILDYAGVPTFDRLVDPGVSCMQRATLAGASPLIALQNAVNTERGRGFAAGDGRYVFHDRIRTLNV